MTVFTREVDPRIVMFLDVLLEDKSSFNILPVCFVFGNQYCTLLSVQFECKLGARFYGTFSFTLARRHRANRESYQRIAAEALTSAPISLTVVVRK